jgi:hypothetical protein
MPYLIDGDNLLGTWPGRKRSDAERRVLTGQLQRFGRRVRRHVMIVFDGPAPPGHPSGSDVRFAGHGGSADDLILATLRSEEDRRGWTVITSDRSLGDQCRWLEARVERSDLFRRRLAAPQEDEKPEREEELDFWLEQFGETDDPEVPDR